MNSHITLDTEHELVLVVEEGRWELEACARAMQEAGRLQQETGYTRILIDHRKVQLELSTAEIFGRVEAIMSQAGGEPAMLAYIFPPAQEDDYRFFEDAALNRGLLLRVFPTPLDAIAWLCGSEPRKS